MLHRPIRTAFVFALILTSTALLASTAAAKSKPAPQVAAQVEWFQYLVKFVCGTSIGDPVRLVPGRYATAVNIFNPGRFEVTVHEHLALAFPPEEHETGEISDVVEVMIPPGAALQVDCEEIENQFVFVNPLGLTDVLEGFLVIESNRPLNAQAVYTAAGASGDVSIDVEKVAETKAIPRPLVSEVKICHFPPGNPGNRHTITIDASALSAHRAHGDTLGECPDDDDEDDD